MDTLKFKKRPSGDYEVVGHEARMWISRYSHYVNTAPGKGWGQKYVKVTYTVVMRSLVDAKNPNSDVYAIAEGRTLAQVKARLARYLADEAAGTLGERHRYGFSLDRRPVGREKAE